VIKCSKGHVIYSRSSYPSSYPTEL